jgi:hypothetical protein
MRTAELFAGRGRRGLEIALAEGSGRTQALAQTRVLLHRKTMAGGQRQDENVGVEEFHGGGQRAEQADSSRPALVRARVPLCSREFLRPLPDVLLVSRVLDRSNSSYAVTRELGGYSFAGIATGHCCAHHSAHAVRLYFKKVASGSFHEKNREFVSMFKAKMARPSSGSNPRLNWPSTSASHRAKPTRPFD